MISSLQEAIPTPVFHPASFSFIFGRFYLSLQGTEARSSDSLHSVAENEAHSSAKRSWHQKGCFVSLEVNRESW